MNKERPIYRLRKILSYKNISQRNFTLKKKHKKLNSLGIQRLQKQKKTKGKQNGQTKLTDPQKHGKNQNHGKNPLHIVTSEMSENIHKDTPTVYQNCA